MANRFAYLLFLSEIRELFVEGLFLHIFLADAHGGLPSLCAGAGRRYRRFRQGSGNRLQRRGARFLLRGWRKAERGNSRVRRGVTDYRGHALQRGAARRYPLERLRDQFRHGRRREGKMLRTQVRRSRTGLFSDVG